MERVSTCPGCCVVCQVNYIEIAKRARVAARDCITSARQECRRNHFTHRGIEVLAIDEHGDRIGDPLDYLEVKTISGKQLSEVVRHHAPAQYDYICIQGGIDFHENLQDALKYPDDYTPMWDEWAINSDGSHE